MKPLLVLLLTLDPAVFAHPAVTGGGAFSPSTRRYSTRGLYVVRSVSAEGVLTRSLVVQR